MHYCIMLIILFLVRLIFYYFLHFLPFLLYYQYLRYHLHCYWYSVLIFAIENYSYLLLIEYYTVICYCFVIIFTLNYITIFFILHIHFWIFHSFTYLHLYSDESLYGRKLCCFHYFVNTLMICNIPICTLLTHIINPAAVCILFLLIYYLDL